MMLLTRTELIILCVSLLTAMIGFYLIGKSHGKEDEREETKKLIDRLEIVFNTYHCGSFVDDADHCLRWIKQWMDRK